MIQPKQWVRRWIDFLFPACCVFCGESLPAERRGQCDACGKIFREERELLCPVCGQNAFQCRCSVTHLKRDVFPGIPLAAGRFYNTNHGSSAGRLTRELVLQCKKRDVKHQPKMLVWDLCIRLTEVLLANGENVRDWIVTYPPRSPGNMLAFGFDHGERLAGAAAQFLECTFAPTLHRTAGLNQKNLGADERFDNAREGLALIPDAVVPNGKYILLDDVVTTGATMSAGVDLLLAGGAAAVLPAACAKAVRFP